MLTLVEILDSGELSSFDISAGQQSYFENLDSFAPDSPSTTYRLKQVIILEK